MSREPTSQQGKIVSLDTGRTERAERKPLSVLFVEDDEIDASLIELSLSKSAKFEMEITRARSVGETTDLLGAAEFDLMLLDYWLGSDSGLELLHMLGGRHGRLPVILLTGHSNQDIQRLGQNAGAVSFLSKDDVSPTSLDTVIQSTLHTHRLESELLSSISERDTVLRDQFELLADIVRNFEKPLQDIGDAADAISRLSKETKAEEEIADKAQSVVANVFLLRATFGRLIELVPVNQAGINLKFEVSDLSDIVEKAVRLVFRQLSERRQSTRFARPDGPVPVKVDRTALLQALLNIISHAGQSSPAGSPVTIDVSVTGDDAVVTVTDQGAGMDAEDIAIALQPLPRRSLHDNEGRRNRPDMGLSIASGIAESHGGRIAIESDPGRGTRVALTLPLQT